MTNIAIYIINIELRYHCSINYLHPNIRGKEMAETVLSGAIESPRGQLVNWSIDQLFHIIKDSVRV